MCSHTVHVDLEIEVALVRDDWPEICRFRDDRPVPAETVLDRITRTSTSLLFIRNHGKGDRCRGRGSSDLTVTAASVTSRHPALHMGGAAVP